ncbi:ABC transporter permease [Thalassospira alkalitolerans]|uniref:ABC transporter permease n=1 Tax=Thalassospira alkalitolerans TaxID=1293890 RepID=UPI003AA9B5C1
MMGRRAHILLWLALPATVFLAVFFILPLIFVVGDSLSDGGAAFGRVAADPIFWSGLRGSMAIGISAPLFSLVIGYFVSLHMARKSERFRAAMMFVISLPLTFSGLVIAYGFILTFGRAGFVTTLLAGLGADPAVIGGFIFSPLGLGFAYSYYLIPRVVMILLPPLINFDHSQILAAKSMGASGFRAHFDILLPQLVPGFISAFCLTSAVAFGAYGTALALVGTQVNILPLVLYSKIAETGNDLPAASAISVVLMSICILVITVAETVTARKGSRSAKGGKSAQSAMVAG